MEYEKLEPEFKEKWIAALRSGKYKQGEEFLAMLSDDESDGDYYYCCLGVAAKICGLSNSEIGGDQLFDDEFGHLGLIPETLHGSTIGIDKNPIIEMLTNMNDGVGAFKNNKQSFEQIANWIEQNL